MYRGPMRAIRRRGVKALVGSSLVMLLALGHPLAASADYHADDPSEGRPLDILEVSSRLVGDPVRIRFTAVFDVLDVRRKPSMDVYIDSQGGGRFDAALLITTRPDKALKCRLQIGVGIEKRWRGRLGPDSISCQVRRKLLPRDGKPIRWAVRAQYRRGMMAFQTGLQIDQEHTLTCKNEGSGVGSTRRIKSASLCGPWLCGAARHDLTVMLPSAPARRGRGAAGPSPPVGARRTGPPSRRDPSAPACPARARGHRSSR